MDVEILDILATEANKVEDLVRSKDHVAFLHPRLRAEASHLTIDECSERQPEPQTVENGREGWAVMDHRAENIHHAAAAAAVQCSRSRSLQQYVHT